MFHTLKRYFHWLHLSMPSGTVESLPDVKDDGRTNLPGVWISGDLTGIPLLKYAAQSGTDIANRASDYLKSKQSRDTKTDILDLCIIGGGISGLSCALRAMELGLTFSVVESNRALFTIHDFPQGKPIYLYPKELKIETPLKLSGDTKESLLKNLSSDLNTLSIVQNKIIQSTVSNIKKETDHYSVLSVHGDSILKSRTICIAIGKSGDYRRLNIPGEDLPKVYNRLHDPKDFIGKKVLIVGGGDTAIETAIAIADAGGDVSLSYRGDSLTKPKYENTLRFDSYIQSSKLQFYPSTQPREIRDSSVVLEDKSGKSLVIKNDIVFSSIGRTAPLEFFRRSGIAISGDWLAPKILSLIAVILISIGLYHWKMDGSYLSEFFRSKGWFPFYLESWRSQFHPNEGLSYVMATNLVSPSFYYSLAYTLLVGFFGMMRISKRPTPYIKLQTVVLFLFQFIPLFFLPLILLPWLGSLGVWDSGVLGWVADEFFPRVDYGLGREYWRTIGFILAWPLFIWNVFSGSPMWGWLVVSLIQTFVIIPIIVWRYGKGAYCGWICSCGALAETLGDEHRKKMPHGIFWNRLNILGQVILFFTLILLVLRLGSWFLPGSIAYPMQIVFNGLLAGWTPVSYYYLVDLWLAGILGVGLYFHFSGRTWCRFACPLAALMHIYAKFSQFRIFSDKKKCISCNVCTTVCHQGIDVMSFANKGIPMEDPQCVRCSACIVNCPTGVLSFGRYDNMGRAKLDTIPSRMA